MRHVMQPPRFTSLDQPTPAVLQRYELNKMPPFVHLKFCHSINYKTHQNIHWQSVLWLRAFTAGCVHTKLFQLCLTLCNLMVCSPPGSSVHGILQARILEWVAMPSSRGATWPRDQNCISYIFWIGRQVLYYQCHLGSPGAQVQYLVRELGLHMSCGAAKLKEFKFRLGQRLEYGSFL